MLIVTPRQISDSPRGSDLGCGLITQRSLVQIQPPQPTHQGLREMFPKPLVRFVRVPLFRGRTSSSSPW